MAASGSAKEAAAVRVAARGRQPAQTHPSLPAQAARGRSGGTNGATAPWKTPPVMAFCGIPGVCWLRPKGLRPPLERAPSIYRGIVKKPLGIVPFTARYSEIRHLVRGWCWGLYRGAGVGSCVLFVVCCVQPPCCHATAQQRSHHAPGHWARARAIEEKRMLLCAFDEKRRLLDLVFVVLLEGCLCVCCCACCALL